MYHYPVHMDHYGYSHVMWHVTTIWGRGVSTLMSVAANGTLLPFQAIYKGLTNKSLLESLTLNHNKVIKADFLLEFSGTKTYWSNQQTMWSFVDNILTPYFDVEKVKLNLLPCQKLSGKLTSGLCTTWKNFIIGWASTTHRFVLILCLAVVQVSTSPVMLAFSDPSSCQ